MGAVAHKPLSDTQQVQEWLASDSFERVEYRPGAQSLELVDAVLKFRSGAADLLFVNTNKGDPSVGWHAYVVTAAAGKKNPALRTQARELTMRLYKGPLSRSFA